MEEKAIFEHVGTFEFRSGMATHEINIYRSVEGDGYIGDEVAYGQWRELDPEEVAHYVDLFDIEAVMR